MTTPTQIDAIRAAVAFVVNQGLSVLVVLGIVGWDAEQLATVNLFLGGIIVLVFLFWKPKGGTTTTDDNPTTPRPRITKGGRGTGPA